MGEAKGDQIKLLFESRKCRNVLNLSEMPREDAVTRSTDPRAEATKDAENPGEVPCPSNTLTKNEGKEDKNTDDTKPMGQYISDQQVAKLLKLADEQEKMAKYLTKLAGMIRSFIKDVYGPSKEGIQWPSFNWLFAIAMIIMVLVILIGVLINYWFGSEPEEPVVPTWWEEVFAFAENLFNFVW